MSMTQNDVVDKTDTFDAPSFGRREFLNALYTGSPDNLYLELRCIHPTTGEARSLWGRIGNKSELAAALKHSEALNREGYGMYFAPCLRKLKQGKAEAAALVPALWVDIDCDGDAHQRDEGLQKLRDFEPAPSFILDSGGGWHGYWLLDEPCQLQGETDRQNIAGILRGLFSALGGDPEYVKTVAGIMRLPNSVNTKPERSGVVVTVVESHPERRYALKSFAWLESQPQQTSFDKLKVVALNGNGHHALPPRTESYLASGAANGSRNTELFAAACQLRDAGYSQTDAERDLIPHHLASGSSDHEALATIRSAYSRSPRDPITQPHETAQARVDTLVKHYHRDQNESERPTAAQVRDVVTACAVLDPLQWAQERKRLKAICGDTFRVEDLNQMYRQARRDLERSQQPATSGMPQYVEIDGAMVFEKSTDRGTVKQTVADWSGHISEWITQVNDDGQAEHLMRLELRHTTHATTLDVPSEMFGDPNALQRFIAQKAGGIYAVCAGMHKHLPSAILKLSGQFPTRQTYRFIGWTQINQQWVYVSPEVSINANGILPDLPEVELESRLHDYGLRAADWERSQAAFQSAVCVLPKTLAPALIAFALLPVIQRFFPAAAPKPALHLVGTTGSGKSEIAALMNSFYGQFTRDTPPAQWGDTVNSVETLGYALADALYWVDDYKTIYSDERTFTRFLQSYSRGMGRGRLTREAKLRQERPCRGLLLSTGETTIEGEASILSRMLVFSIPPWEKRDPGGQALAKAEALRDALPGFTAQFIQWISKLADDGTLIRELASRFESNTKGYQDKLRGKLGRQAHTGRMIQNWAVLVTVYQMLANFLHEQDDDLLPGWQDAILETVQLIQQERVGQLFIDTLEQLLASGEALIVHTRTEEEAKPGVTIIGYQDDRFVYLLPEIAYREAVRVNPLKFSAPAIGSQLKEDGWLVAGNSDSHLTVQIRIRGRRTRVWRLKTELFDGDSGDSSDGSVATERG
jgi:hypothetical protein